MKYVYRGRIIFQYDPGAKYDKVTMGYSEDGILEFDMCILGPEDFRLFADFFTTVYKHIQGEPVELKDIEVY